MTRMSTSRPATSGDTAAKPVTAVSPGDHDQNCELDGLADQNFDQNFVLDGHHHDGVWLDAHFLHRRNVV